MKITDIETRNRMSWEHGDYAGTIEFPDDDRGPVKIDWDVDCPDDWEDIEEAVQAAAVNELSKLARKRTL